MRLIGADALTECINAQKLLARESVAKRILHMIDDAPTIEAAPVVHGEWIDSDEHKGFEVCSACHGCYVDDEWVVENKWNYCPNCGAKMSKTEEQTNRIKV